jgi:hypothetical protein
LAIRDRQDARKQLRSLSGGWNATFEYDGIGRRRKQTVDGTTEFLYDDRLNSVRELAGGIENARLLTGDIDEVFMRTAANGTVTLLKDALGSTVALVNSSGGVETQYTYEPFGAVSNSVRH